MKQRTQCRVELVKRLLLLLLALIEFYSIEERILLMTDVITNDSDGIVDIGCGRKIYYGL